MLDRLGQAARAARLEAGRTQLDIASAAGVSHAVISRLETGTRWPENPDRVIAGYAAECGVDEDAVWRAALEADRLAP